MNINGINGKAMALLVAVSCTMTACCSTSSDSDVDPLDFDTSGGMNLPHIKVPDNPPDTLYTSELQTASKDSPELAEEWCESSTRSAMVKNMRTISKEVTTLLYHRMLGKDPHIYRYDEWKSDLVSGYTGEGGIVLNGVSSPNFEPKNSSMFAWVDYDRRGYFDPSAKTNHFSVGAYLPRLEKHVEVSVLFGGSNMLEGDCKSASIDVSEVYLRRGDEEPEVDWARMTSRQHISNTRLRETHAYDLFKEIVGQTELSTEL